MENFTAHWDALHRYLMRRTSDREKARDIAQEAYLRLLHIKNTDHIRSPKAYLLRIASHLLHAQLLRDKRDPLCINSELVENSSTLDHQTSDPSEAVDVEAQIDSALAQLPPLYAAILVLKKRDGFSLQEIALKLDISFHTAKKYLWRALTICRQESHKANLTLMMAMLLFAGCAQSRTTTPQAALRCEWDQPHMVIDGKRCCQTGDNH